MNLSHWEKIFEEKIKSIASIDDPAHDLLHFKRVVGLSKFICEKENGNPEIVIPAAWLHDFVIVPKDSPLRSQASRLSAEKAVEFLQEVKYPQKYYNEIGHAIEGHSFSANIEIKTIEAKIVQDSDRLDGLGAIGLARCFATAGLMRRSFYDGQDPFCTKRAPDDSLYTIDHFYKKLFITAETLKTKTGKELGQKRVQYMQEYLDMLGSEIIRPC